MRVVTTIHEDKASGLGSKSSLYQKAYPPFEAVVFGLSDGFVVHSEYHLARLPKRVRERSSVIEFGTVPCEVRADFEHQATTVGCFGIIAPYKGIETVVEASAIAAKRVPDMRLVIAGAVPPSARQKAYFESMQRFAEERLPGRVEIHANLPAASFDALYHRSGLIGFGFQRVNQSTTFHKALEHVKPVVATNVGGVGELTAREKLGRVVHVGDARAMASEMVDLLSDGAAYDAHRNAIQDYIGRRTWRQNSNEHLDLYESVLAA
jgi:glycosyltransferase involved in cell wall biosynthesis